jgi:energy-coupling factor transport system substrate-specific component
MAGRRRKFDRGNAPVKDVIHMWKYTKMVVLVALTAAVYAGTAVPFKGIQIIPGFAEFRPAGAIPVVFGLIFGPAGAWGSGIGNLIGDFFGTLGIGSIPGAIGNFFFGLVGYKVWGNMGWFSSKGDLNIRTKKQVFQYILVAILSCATVAFIIAWGLELLKLLPFASIGAVIMTNNLIFSIVIGPFLLLLLYPRALKWGLYWREIMDRAMLPAGLMPRVGALCIWIGAVGGLIMGFLLSTGLYHGHLFQFAEGTAGSGVVLGVLPFLILFFIGCLLS